jgi:hypothetical protein
VYSSTHSSIPPIAILVARYSSTKLSSLVRVPRLDSEGHKVVLVRVSGAFGRRARSRRHPPRVAASLEPPRPASFTCTCVRTYVHAQRSGCIADASGLSHSTGRLGRNSMN